MRDIYAKDLKPGQVWNLRVSGYPDREVIAVDDKRNSADDAERLYEVRYRIVEGELGTWSYTFTGLDMVRLIEGQ